MTGYSYCTHDEGEPCDCATTLALSKTPSVAVRPGDRRAADRAAAIAQLTADRWTTGEIAALLGVSGRTVERLRGRAA